MHILLNTCCPPLSLIIYQIVWTMYGSVMAFRILDFPVAFAKVSLNFTYGSSIESVNNNNIFGGKYQLSAELERS